MKVKELKELLNQFSDDDEMVFSYTDHEYSCRVHGLDCNIRKETLRVFSDGYVSDGDIYSRPYSEKEFVVLDI